MGPKFEQKLVGYPVTLMPLLYQGMCLRVGCHCLSQGLQLDKIGGDLLLP